MPFRKHGMTSEMSSTESNRPFQIKTNISDKSFSLVTERPIEDTFNLMCVLCKMHGLHAVKCKKKKKKNIFIIYFFN